MHSGPKLLLIIDVQRGFIRRSTGSVIEPINRIARVFYERGWPVICTRFINLPGSNWERLRGWTGMQHEPDTRLADELDVQTQYIFKKSTYSGWSHEVQIVCQNNNVRDVVITGIDTNECVLATALAVFDAGYTPWVVEDACATGGGELAHDRTIDLLKPLLGARQIIRSDTLIQTKGETV
jgi:nicotinamidase-related amidase